MDATQGIVNRVLAYNGWHNTNPQGYIGKAEFLHECGSLANVPWIPCDQSKSGDSYLEFICTGCDGYLMVNLTRLVTGVHSLAFQIMPGACIRLSSDKGAR